MAHDIGEFDVAQWIKFCVEPINLNVFRLALDSVPSERRQDWFEQLRLALTNSRTGEPTHQQMRPGVELTERMRTPETLLRQQIRLEKLRILAEQT